MFRYAYAVRAMRAGASVCRRHRARRWTARCAILLATGVLLAIPMAAHLAATTDKPAWLNQAEWNFIQQQGAIKIAPDPTFPPVEEIDHQGIYRGIAADYVHLLEAKLKIRFSVIDLKNWDAVLDAAKERRVDLLPAAANTPKRQEFLLFSSPHLVLPGVIMVRTDTSGDLGLKDLVGKKVAVVSGYLWQEYLETDHKEIQIVPVPNLSAGLQMVSLGEADAVIEALPIAIHFIERAGITNLRVAGETGYFTRLSFATRKDWPLLNSVIEKTLAQITPAEKRDIFNKWISLKAQSEFPWQTFWRVVAVTLFAVALLLGLGLIWIRSLRHQVKLRTAILDRQAERLRESEERLRGFAEAPSDWFYEVNENLEVTYISPNFTEVTGVDVAFVLGRTCTELVSATFGKTTIEQHEEALRQRVPFRDFEFEIAMPDGPPLSVSVSAKPVFDDEGRFLGYRGIGNDVAEKRRLQAGVRTAEARAYEAQKMEAIGQMTGGIAHDFNNLLQVILGNADFLEAESLPGTENHSAAQQIRLASERAARLTQHLLAFARRQPLQPAPMDLVEVVGSLRPLLARVLGEAIELRCELPVNPISAIADRAQVESALINLALNARDAMPDGGVMTVAIDVIECDAAAATRSDLAAGAYARLRVSDTGTGMTPGVKEKAFDPFFTTKDVGKGSGLGLSMVFGFAKQSGGTVELDSAPGLGTTLTVLLPCAQAAVEAGPAPKVEELPPASGPVTVLVVEDDPLVRTQVVLSIRALGYEVIAVENGPAALDELAQGRKVDVLFTDIVMPGGMNGHDLAVEAGALRPGLRVLFTSGFPDSAAAQQRLDAAVRLLAKPYRRADLARALHDVLEGTHSNDGRVPPSAASNG
jgi:PAS domain S-box-containing protein